MFILKNIINYKNNFKSHALCAPFYRTFCHNYMLLPCIFIAYFLVLYSQRFEWPVTATLNLTREGKDKMPFLVVTLTDI